MTNNEILSVWVVKNGSPYAVDGCNIHDELRKLGCTTGNESDWVIVRASDENGAIAFANLYDSELVEYGNYVCPFCGRTHIAVN